MCVCLCLYVDLYVYVYVYVYIYIHCICMHCVNGQSAMCCQGPKTKGIIDQGQSRVIPAHLVDILSNKVSIPTALFINADHVMTDQ